MTKSMNPASFSGTWVRAAEAHGPERWWRRPAGYRDAEERGAWGRAIGRESPCVVGGEPGAIGGPTVRR
jgi:hypothetical protein